MEDTIWFSIKIFTSDLMLMIASFSKILVQTKKL
jgi:hypothetical protein